MAYTETDLRAAAAAGVLDTAQLDRLIAFLRERGGAAALAAPAPRFDVAHLLWYAGALIVMTAMGLFSTLAFSQMGGEALAVTAVVYAAAFTAAGHYLWHTKNLRTPGGLLIAVAVSMAPLAVYGIQDALELVGPVRQARHGPGLLCLDQGQLDFHGDRRDRRCPDRAALLSVPVHRGDHRRRALVHVDGPRPVDRWHRAHRLGACAQGFALVRARRRWSSPGSSTHRAKGRLCVLAASVRHDRVLGRGEHRPAAAARSRKLSIAR